MIGTDAMDAPHALSGNVPVRAPQVLMISNNLIFFRRLDTENQTSLSRTWAANMNCLLGSYTCIMMHCSKESSRYAIHASICGSPRNGERKTIFCHYRHRNLW